VPHGVIEGVNMPIRQSAKFQACALSPHWGVRQCRRGCLLERTRARFVVSRLPDSGTFQVQPPAKESSMLGLKKASAYQGTRGRSRLRLGSNGL
jgi:hypothetical protein